MLVYMHGGGYVTGSLETDDRSCRAIALAVPVMVVSIDYRLAPENKFSTGFEDCHDVLRWVQLSSLFSGLMLIRTGMLSRRDEQTEY